MTGEVLPASGDVAVQDREAESDVAGMLSDTEAIVKGALDPMQMAMPATVCMNSSSNVQIGPRLHYNAPVVINQYVQVTRKKEQAFDSLQDHPSKWRRFLVERRLYWGAMGILIGGVVLLAVILYFTLGRKSSDDDLPEEISIVGHYTTRLPPTDAPPDPNITLNNYTTILPRDYWASYPPLYVTPLPHPTPYVVITHTEGEPCDEKFTCRVFIKDLFNVDVGMKDAPDIGYNFFIDSKGQVYEGRGWDATNIFESFVKQKNLAISFMGNYIVQELTSRQIQSLKDLLSLGVRLRKLDKCYLLLAHHQVSKNIPAKNILKVIDTWAQRCSQDCETPAARKQHCTEPSTN